MPKFQPKVIWDSNRDFWINPDPNVCQVCREMLWMHYLVSISHFAKYGTHRPLTVSEMLTNVQKSPFRNGEENEKSDLESKHGSGSPQKVNHF